MRRATPAAAAVAATLALLASAGAARAQPAENVAAQLANPVANVVSVPFQWNLDRGGGRGDALGATLNIQPVIPFALNEDWNLISRTILPLRYMERVFPDHRGGLGDAVQSFFLSPQRPVRGVTWGAGPVFLLPTATNDLGQRQWAAGPTAVALRQSGPWLYGVLGNHLWSLGGAPDRAEQANATFLQPFVTYAFPSQTSLFVNAESTYDWSRRQWTVPVNAGVAQVVPIGGQIMQFSAGVRAYAAAPERGPDWGVRVAATFVFPRRP